MPSRIITTDTIAAISTPLGEGGIGIIRLSGPDAIKIASKIFKPKKNINLEKQKSHTLHFGYIIKGKTVLDEVLVSIMKSPYSYTKEDVVEINCHSGVLILISILELALGHGARTAQPGEFTKRAFLNGRIDLSQAESVIDLIRSMSSKGLKLAAQQLSGKLSVKIKKLRMELLDLLARIEALLNFPEDEVSSISRSTILSSVKKMQKKIESLIDTADQGEIFRHGVKTVIVGKPNVGKSSLLNILVEEERAIVTEIPGTTRDTVEGQIHIQGLSFILIDTAGLQPVSNIVERIGIARSKKKLLEADLILLMLDANTTINSNDKKLFELVKGRHTIVLLNKIDLPSKTKISDIRKLVPKGIILKISAKKEIGIDELKNTMFDIALSKFKNPQSAICVNMRHKESLLNAQKSLAHIIHTMTRTKLTEEFVSLDLKNALDSLGQITGETVNNEVLDRIFSKFCIGK
ncbi:tRNA uridine-5-carboxymethylaminomethyl(34) synthesis GTPase MnmE [bacterium]|nr:tRNA uridine-5-carboxymethylaminomethyl(34) synthesis GTPase MnmE [bacterium]